MIGWKAWYADGSIYNSIDHNWKDLPDDGVVVVVCYQDWIPSSNKTSRYRRINDGYDYYFYYIDTIICNDYTPEENLERFPEANHFKKGKWVSDSKYNEIYHEAEHSTWVDETIDRSEGCENC